MIKTREQELINSGLVDAIKSQYQLNGNILMLMSTSLGVPLNQLLALSYKKD